MHPFGASIEGVKALLPHRRIRDVAPVAPAAGETFTTVAQVDGWLAEYAAEVDARLGDYELIPGVTATWIASVTTRAAGLVHTAAAATAEAAGHPERTDTSTDSYSTVLWNRYTRGLDRLTADVEQMRTQMTSAATTTPQWRGPTPGWLLRRGSGQLSPYDHVDRRRPYR